MHKTFTVIRKCLLCSDTGKISICVRLLWRVERVIILFCYFNCNSIIYIFVFISFVTFIILILS